MIAPHTQEILTRIRNIEDDLEELTESVAVLVALGRDIEFDTQLAEMAGTTNQE